MSNTHDRLRRLLLLPLPAARHRLCTLGLKFPEVPQMISARVCKPLRAIWQTMLLPTVIILYVVVWRWEW